MANHPSALKRAKQNVKRSLRNKSRNTAVKTMTKILEATISEKKPEDSDRQYKTAQQLIAKTAAKGVFPKKTASRKISRLARRVNTLAKSPQPE